MSSRLRSYQSLFKIKRKSCSLWNLPSVFWLAEANFVFNKIVWFFLRNQMIYGWRKANGGGVKGETV